LFEKRRFAQLLQQQIDRRQIIFLNGLRQVGNDPQYSAGIKLGRVSGEYQADLEIFHLGLQLVDSFFLLSFGEKVSKTANAFHVVDIGKGSVFDRIEKDYLAFNELDKTKQNIDLILFGFYSGMLAEEIVDDLPGGFPLLKTLL